MKSAGSHICVIGGWCGNRMVIVAEHIDGVLRAAGFNCRISHHSVWENYSQPPSADLILQLLPAFSEVETICPIVNIRPMLVDLDHPETLNKILEKVRSLRPA
jgi:hypothetical protein